MSHTPGPWKVCGDGDCSCKTVMCGDHPIAVVTHGEWGDEFPSIRLVGPSMMARAEAYIERFAYGSVPVETARANALLIAAAPDLLAALHTAVERIAASHFPNKADAEQATAEFRAVIAKAEGR